MSLEQKGVLLRRKTPRKKDMSFFLSAGLPVVMGEKLCYD